MKDRFEGWFICGMPRSGTTLLRSILASHSRVVVPPETHFFGEVVSFYGHEKIFDEREGLDFLASFENWNKFSEFGLEEGLIGKHLGAVDEVSLRDIFDTFMELLARSEGKDIWCEKTPLNEMHLKSIKAWYSDAKLIYLARDPRAVIASIFQAPWPRKNVYTYSKRWRKSVQAYLLNTQKFIAVRYEDLVIKPEAVARQLCESLGIIYEPEMITDRDRSIKEQGKGWSEGALGAVKKEIHSESIEKWKNQLSKYQVWCIELLLRKYMSEFSYRRTSRGRDSVIGIFVLVWSILSHYCAGGIWHIKKVIGTNSSDLYYKRKSK